VNFSLFQAATHNSRVNCSENTGDRQRQFAQKTLALNADFNSASFDPVDSVSSPYECIKSGYPY